MVVWSCPVRRVLGRLASGKNIFNGKPFPTLSPHHPISHGKPTPKGGNYSLRCGSSLLLYSSFMRAADDLVVTSVCQFVCKLSFINTTTLYWTPAHSPQRLQ